MAEEHRSPEAISQEDFEALVNRLRDDVRMLIYIKEDSDSRRRLDPLPMFSAN